MRRFIVICLILLFPLQVFADSAEDYPPAYAVTDTQADVSCSTVSSQSFSPCAAVSGKLVPAHLDFADILVPAPAAPLPHHDGNSQLMALDFFLNAIPARLSKPPPRISSTSRATRILLDALSVRV